MRELHWKWPEFRFSKKTVQFEGQLPFESLIPEQPKILSKVIPRFESKLGAGRHFLRWTTQTSQSQLLKIPAGYVLGGKVLALRGLSSRSRASPCQLRAIGRVNDRAPILRTSLPDSSRQTSIRPTLSVVGVRLIVTAWWNGCDWERQQNGHAVCYREDGASAASCGAVVR